jgi:hypothetical protein
MSLKPDDSEKVYVWVVICLVVVAILWLVGIATANARPMSNLECGGIANDMGAVAQLRDQGAPQADVEALMDEVLRPHLGEEGSYIQFETDIEFMVSMVPLIYSSKMEPKAIAESAYKSCTKYGFGIAYRINKLEEMSSVRRAT